MDEATFKARTLQLGVGAIRLAGSLPRNSASDVIGRQLIRCTTSVGANYRAACRGRSKQEVVSKLGIVEEEADETLYWLEMPLKAELCSAQSVAALAREADEILRMVVASRRTLKAGLASETANKR